MKGDAPGFTSSVISSKVLKDDFDEENRLMMMTGAERKIEAKQTKRKGYCSLQTNMGTLNFEIHCDLTPLAAENFLTLCERGYYDGCLFHRSIPKFMIQGGDPSGSGSGGESIWRREFKDEFNKQLNHKGAGVLSMANAGKDTNKSQFFVTFRATPHLDNKHTVFGRLVGGMEILKLMEKVATDSSSDRPLVDIKIEKAVVFVNPFRKEEMEQETSEERAKKATNKRSGGEVGGVDEGMGTQWFSNPVPQLPQTTKTGPGKYIGVLHTSSSMAPPSSSTSTRRPSQPQQPQQQQTTRGNVDEAIDFSFESMPEHPKKLFKPSLDVDAAFNNF
mgnify:CR=1 FL=1